MTVKKFIPLIFLTIYLLISSDVCAQSRLVMNNDPYVVYANGSSSKPVYLVLNNSNANSITLSGTGGNIISENEYHILKWNIGTQTGNYTVPFTKTSGNKIPYTLNITNAGSGSGNIKFSTYTSNSANTPFPSDVTFLNDISTNSDNSLKVIDRFWIIDANGYTTKPTSTMLFTYLHSEYAAPNTITESNLRAQRFNSTLPKWGDYLPQGTIDIGANTVSSVPAAPADFFRSWTLVDNSSPLPIELLYFNGLCSDNQLKLFWATQTETNNDFFTIEESSNGSDFTEMRRIKGAGNSNKIRYYQVNIPGDANEQFYFRLKQTDFNGKYHYYSIIHPENNCVKKTTRFFYSVSPNPATSDNLKLTLFSPIRQNISVSFYSLIGQLVYEMILPVGNDQPISHIFQLQHLTPAMYLMVLSTSSNNYVEKIIVK